MKLCHRVTWDKFSVTWPLFDRMFRNKGAFDTLAESASSAMPIIESLNSLSIFRVSGATVLPRAKKLHPRDHNPDQEILWTMLLNLQSDSWGKRSFFLSDTELLHSVAPAAGDAIFFHRDIAVESSYGEAQVHIEVEAPVLFSKNYCNATDSRGCCWGGCPHLGRVH